MVNARLLLRAACLFAIPANAESSSTSGTDSSSTSTTNGGVIVLTGVTEEATPTGSYITYSSTVTVGTSSTPITTSPLLSTVTSGSTTITSTIGSTTIFSYNTGDIVGNATSSTGSSSSSQLFLSGKPQPTTTSNSTGTATSDTGPLPTCNQYAEFCNRSYGNITEVSAHNSPFVRANNAAANQALDVTMQLDDGIRMLQGQIHWNNSVPHFCHTSCDVLDVGPITDYLGQVKDWVARHPFDVVTILLENGDYKPVEDYVPFLEQTGLSTFAYTPPMIPMGKKDWPPLSHFILTGKRVVFFMDYNANQTSVPWILDEFSQVWETPFDPTDSSFPCDVQRPPNLSPEDAKQRMYLTNHNLNYDINLLGSSLLVPNIPLLNTTNNVTGVGSLGVGAQDCDKMWGYPPKFLNVDYYNIPNGTVFEVAAQWNNVTYNRTCCGLAANDSMKLGASSGRNAILSAVLAMLLVWGIL
jgi:hypothetical protein